MTEKRFMDFWKPVCVVLLLSCQAMGQEEKEEDREKKEFKIETIVGWKGCYRPGDWTPMLVGITYTPKKGTPKEPLAVTVRVSAMQDGLNNMLIERPVILLPEQRKDEHFILRLARDQEGISISITDQSGRERWKNESDQFAYNSTNAIEIKDSDILVASSGSTSRDLASMGRRKELIWGDSVHSDEIFVRQKESRYLPWDRPAYSNLDLLILSNIDWSDPAMLRPGQVEAICQWVRQGGTLLVALGPRELPADHPLAKIIPIKIGKQTAWQIPSGTLTAMNCHDAARRSDTLAPQVIRPLDGPLPAGWQEEYFPIENPSGKSLNRMLIWGPLGFGRLGVLSFDPSGLEGLGNSSGNGTEIFWAKIIKTMVRDTRGMTGGGTGDYNLGSRKIESSNEAVLNYLVNIPQMQPLSIWWVIGLLALLGLLLGPVDYFVLKKLKVQPLTWLTSAVVIILFTVGAYYGVRYIRGNIMRIRAVSVIDAPAGKAEGWSVTYAGIFAPDTDSYEITGLDGKTLAQTPEFAAGWWSGESSFQSVRQRIGTRNIYCRQDDGANMPTSVPISIWTMQHLLCQSRVAKMPFSAEIDEYGNVAVSNHIANPIKHVWLMRNNGDRPYTTELGSIPAGARKVFKDETSASNSLDDLAGRIMCAPAITERTRAMEPLLKAGATVVIVEYENVPLPFAVKGYSSEVEYTAFARQVVFPRSAGRSGTGESGTTAAMAIKRD